VLSDGTITAKHNGVVVPSPILDEMWGWKRNRFVTQEDVVDWLREGSTMPSGYAYNSWKQGEWCVLNTSYDSTVWQIKLKLFRISLDQY